MNEKSLETLLQDDIYAAQVGESLARDFGLKQDWEHPDRFVTASGTFTARGIARRAYRILSIPVPSR